MTITKLTPKQLHEAHEIPECMDYAAVEHQYVQLTQLWRTIGYRCKHCDVAFKSKTFLYDNFHKVVDAINKCPQLEIKVIIVWKA